MTWYPADPRLDRWLAIYRAVAHGNGAEPDAGRRLLAWAQAAGAAEVTPSASVWCYATPEDRAWWGGMWADRILTSAITRQAVDGGHADQAELERDLRGLARVGRRNDDGWFAILARRGPLPARPMTGRAEVADQARAVAAAWSPPGAPESWWLTAETFAAIAEDDVLLDLAVEVPADRLPPLLLSAAITLLVTEQAPEPLAGYYPRPGRPQPPRDDGFRPALHAFALAEGDALRRLCGQHRYQMNEVGRCADVLPALALVGEADPRPLALVDLGTGAGLGLHLDRYRYTYELPGGDRLVAGDATSEWP